MSYLYNLFLSEENNHNVMCHVNRRKIFLPDIVALDFFAFSREGSVSRCDALSILAASFHVYRRGGLSV